MRERVAAPPALVALAGIALLTIMDGAVKGLATEFATFQLVCARFAFGALWTGLLLAATRPGWPRRRHLPGHAGRALLVVLTTGSFFYALGRMPLAQLFALTFTAPVFIALFGALFLGERADWRVMAAIGAGSLGVAAIVQDGLSAAAGEPLAYAAALLSPVSYALSIVLLRSQTAHEPPAVIVFAQAAFVAAFSLPLAALDFTVPDGPDLAAFALVGLLGTAGYLCYASALKSLTAARFAIVEYTGLLWAAAIGYAFFSEVPGLQLWIGAAFIVAGCLLALAARKG